MNKMGEGNYQRYVVGFILFTLFSFLLLQWIGEMGVLHDVDTSTIRRGSLDPSQFNSSIISNVDASQHGRKNMLTGQIQDIDNPSGPQSILNTFGDFTTTPFKLMGQTFHLIGVPDVVGITLIIIFSIIMALAAWRVLRIGD